MWAWAERQLTRRRFTDTPELIREVYASLVDSLEKRGLLHTMPFDDSVCDGATFRDIDKAQVVDFVETAEAKGRLTLKGSRAPKAVLQNFNLLRDEKPAKSVLLNILREKGLIRKGEKGAVYKAMASGLLFLGKNPSEVFPQCRILVDAYDGREPDPNPKDQNTFSCPAPRMVDQVVEFVMSNTRHPIRVAGIHRVKLDEYPREVIREAIVNAIAHRDYEDAARPIYVKLFFDRVEILSPGRLLRPLTISKLVKGNYEPCSRNPMLAQYLGHLHLMEQRGTGIRRMQSAMLDHGLDAPEYSFRDGYFTVVLRGPDNNVDRIKMPSDMHVSASIEERLTGRQREIVKWLATGESITNRECQDRFSISKVTATKDLSTLVEFGLAERIGKGRSVRYIYRGGNR
ncbi:MAG: ATP-binding protein [Candidatus Tritonobacter lacicola]|nr:ATP-binding protein [Candidatus Tritonobacter lacicola]